MADNVDVTEGAGKTVATDDIQVDGSHAQGQVQFVKIVDGTLNGTGSVRVNQAAKANALTIAPASDIADATYIGDIKFGESLPAGTNEIGKLAAGTAAIGKLAANSGVDIGDVTLTAGTNAFGKLSANSGVDIGDVDVTSIVPGVGATNLGKAEDAAHASGDVGVAALSVRADAAAALSGADNDYQPLITDANGRLHVIDVSTTAIKTAVEIMDDWDAVHDSAVSSDGPQVMAAYDSTKPAVVEDGDAVRMLADQFGRLLAGVEPQRFQAVFDSADASGEGNAVHASAASTIIVVQSYVISVDAEMWVKLQEEDSTALTGKFWLKAGGGVAITLPDKAPIVLGVDSDLEVITEGAGTISVSVTGYTIPG